MEAAMKIKRLVRLSYLALIALHLFATLALAQDSREVIVIDVE